jgi:hypothetical protein
MQTDRQTHTQQQTYIHGSCFLDLVVLLCAVCCLCEDGTGRRRTPFVCGSFFWFLVFFLLLLGNQPIRGSAHTRCLGERMLDLCVFVCVCVCVCVEINCFWYIQTIDSIQPFVVHVCDHAMMKWKREGKRGTRTHKHKHNNSHNGHEVCINKK